MINLLIHIKSKEIDAFESNPFAKSFTQKKSDLF